MASSHKRPSPSLAYPLIPRLGAGSVSGASCQSPTRGGGSADNIRRHPPQIARLVSVARGILRLVIRVVTSHRTEVLLDAFVRDISVERERKGAFAPLAVVVPNSNVEAYLRLGVAERLGIAANIKTTFLRKFLAGLALRAVPGARVADAESIEGHLLALLHDDALLAGADLAQVRGYLLAAGADRDAVDRRRCQLAEALARLFDEYASSRPEMLAAWKGGGRV